MDTLTILVFAFGVALLTTLACTRIVLGACRRWQLHEPGAPPRLGGLAIAAGFATPLALVLAGAAGAPGLDVDATRLVATCVASAAVLALGAYDDVRGATVSQKLAIQLIVAAATWTVGFRIEMVTLPFDVASPLAGWASVSLTILWIMGVMNAVNLIDGLDGLAAGVCAIAVLTLLGLGWIDGETVLCICAASLAGALVGFLFHNFSPASIFMGDSGSLFIGYVLAVVSIASTNKQDTAWALLLPILALGLPVADTFAAVLRRIRAGRPVTAADSDHVHHRLLKAGWSQRDAVLLLYAVCLVLAAATWTLKVGQDPAKAIAFTVAAGVVAFVIHIFGLPSELAGRGDHSAPPLDRSRDRARARAIRDSNDLDDLWSATRAALEALGATGVVLDLYTRESPRFGFDSKDSRRRASTTSIELGNDTHRYGRITVYRTRHFDPVVEWRHEIQLHIVGEALNDALERMLTGPGHRLVVTQLPSGAR